MFGFHNNFLLLNVSMELSWNSTVDAGNPSRDLTLAREAADTLAQRRGTNAQTFRLYNTYTDASNYERGIVRWASNGLEIGTEAAGSGTGRDMRFFVNGISRANLSATVLEVSTSADASIRLTRPTTSQQGAFTFRTGATDQWSIGLNSSNSNNLLIQDGTLFGTNAVTILKTSRNVGLSTTSPTAMLDVNSDTIRLRTARTPTSGSAAGNTGDISWDADYFYICVGTNTWKRAALSTW